MGSELVRLAFARWNHLPDRAFRLLAFMALVTMDDDEAPAYWGGRESLAMALGRMTPAEPARSDSSARANEFRKARRADFEAVKAGIRELISAGVITCGQLPAPGRNAVYLLHLDARTGKAEPVERGRLTLSTGQGEPVEQGRVTLPLTTKELQELQTQEPKSTQVTTSLVALLEYEKAQEFLAALPDLGMEFIAAVDGEHSMQETVILAAAAAKKAKGIPA